MNNCRFIKLRGNPVYCNKPCLGQFCAIHNFLIKSNGGSYTVYFCPFCRKVNKSKYGVCYKCYYSKNVLYFLRSPNGSNIPPEIVSITYKISN